MTDFNVHIHAYADLQLLADCIESVREHAPDVPIHVFDGRYETFGDADDPPTSDFMTIEHAYANVTLHDPGPLAPFPAREDRTLRADVATKTRWAWEHLPADEWTLKLDTDELLHRFDVPWADLGDDHRYCPEIVTTMGRKVNVARLFKPGHWTPWVDDCLLPRALFPMDTPLRVLKRAYDEDDWRAVRFLKRAPLEGVTIRNRGPERPDAYQRARARQLEAFGREDRFQALKAGGEL